MGTLALFVSSADEAGGAIEFGSIPLSEKVELMQVRRSAGGELRFMSETEATLRRTARALRWVDSCQRENLSSWWELSVTVPSKGGPVKAGHWFVVAQWPWARAQVNAAPFKRGSKKGPEQRPAIPVGKFSTEADLFDWLATLTQDFWEKGDGLVASVPRPTPLQDGGENLRNIAGSKLTLGVCEERCDLLAAELVASPRACDLLARLKRDDLNFWFKPGTALMKKLPKGAYDEVKEMGQLLLHFAASAALAGPDKESERWNGEPVMNLVDWIFRDLINLHNRRAESRRGSNETGLHEDISDQVHNDGAWAE